MKKNNRIMISCFQLHKNMCCHEKNCDFFINLETSDIKLYFGTRINEQNFFLKNGSHVHVCKEKMHKYRQFCELVSDWSTVTSLINLLRSTNHQRSTYWV